MTATLDELLARMGPAGARDLYLLVGAPPTLAVDDRLVAAGERPLSGADVERLLSPLLQGERAAAFARRPELDLAREVPGAGRFRINLYRQRGQPGLVARRIRADVPTLEELGLPAALGDVALERRGVVLVTGAAGSGKSSTLAALVRRRSAAVPGHIITIEDPLEFVHPHGRSLVSQREVGVDTLSFHDALRGALRQAPDVLLIGEVRDRETAEAALRFAETGHLVLATLHATNTVQAVERLVHLFPPELHAQALLSLSLSLVAVVGQRLVPRADGHGRAAAVEVLLPTGRVREHVRAGDADGLRAALRAGGDGMQAFDEALRALVQRGQVTAAVAASHADSPGDLLLRLKLDEAPARAAPAGKTRLL
ncbi:MAG: PilT/PilU family type 4a pilus ATPase [Planctomycetes bacterium]|nr:PilT/PilU family type 4a pilus ATPase [Planctomycetota bacterium]